MSDPVRVLVVGTGQMGSGIARLVLEKRGLALVGACARRPSRAGIDVGSAIGLDRGIGIEVSTDLAATIERCRPHVAIQATCSKLGDAAEEIATLAAAGVHVISIAEEMAFPRATSPALALRLHQQAIDNGVCILGTGINPGFVLDLLVIVLSGVCCHVDRIRATRVNDLSPYGPSVLRSQGVGLTPEAFRRGVEDGSVVGHVGFPESLHMIAAALGWEIERIEQTREPIVSSVVRESEFVRVAPGLVAGCHHTAVAFVDGIPAISLIHPQQIHPGLEGVETGDTIEILGTPDVRLAGSPEIPGGTGTIALAVNSIPLVLGASPGLYSAAELPVPAALMSDAGSFVHRGDRRVGMRRRAAQGTWVEIHRVVLSPEDRAQKVPDDTRRVPLEMKVKGFLARDGVVGEEAEILTLSGRRLRGTLTRLEPAYTHGFGRPIPELAAIGPELRAMLERSRGA